MKLIISGLIQDEKYFNEKVKPYLDDKQIIYVGNSGPAERDRLLGEAYALLHPINFEEPFGLSVVESFFCGTPVVAFKRGAMPELILNGKTGFLVNSIKEALNSLDKIKSIKREDCRKWAESKFTREKMVEDYISVYKKILKI